MLWPISNQALVRTLAKRDSAKNIGLTTSYPLGVRLSPIPPTVQEDHERAWRPDRKASNRFFPGVGSGVRKLSPHDCR